MKKIYTLSVSVVMLLFCGESFSQVTYSNLNMIQTGNAGDELIFGSTLINTTSGTISLRVTRQQDVMGQAANWTSAFCMDVCYLPTTDSVNYSFLPKDTVDFTFHMYTDATPEHATAVMRWKNTANASNTFDQTFFGSTDGSMGINDLDANSAKVNIYPMPITSGDICSVNVSTLNNHAGLTLQVYNMYGSLVNTTNIITGINLMNFNLPAGMYSYNVIAAGDVVNSGKLSIVK